MSGRILVLGGYGAVGREAVAAIRGWYDGTVVVAGRDPAKADLALDITDTAALEAAVQGADAVLNCVEGGNARVAEICLRHGVHYLDITATPEIHREIEALEATRSTAVLSVGLAPGVTNLLAASLRARTPVGVTSGAHGEAGDIKVGVLLGAGERHGPSAIEWTIDGLAQLGDSWQIRFPEPYGLRTVRTFPFAGPPTGFCLDSRLLTASLGLAARAPGLTRMLSRLHVGGDGFAVVATDGRGSASYSGRRQSRATGLVASMLLQRLKTFEPGVKHIEQLVDPEEFLRELNGYAPA